jgi:hypothetical protein
VPLFVLEGVFSVAELHTAVLESWWIVVHHEEQLAMIEQCPVPPGTWASSGCARSLGTYGRGAGARSAYS